MFGTGPIKGFAVTLSIGILSSMFTSIIFTKVLADLIYARNIQNKKIKLRV
jgi:preprotein translocase subunit SecD